VNAKIVLGIDTVGGDLFCAGFYAALLEPATGTNNRNVIKGHAPQTYRDP